MITFRLTSSTFNAHFRLKFHNQQHAPRISFYASLTFLPGWKVISVLVAGVNRFKFDWKLVFCFIFIYLFISLFIFTFFNINRRKYWFRANFRLPVFFYGFTHFAMSWTRFGNFWKMSACVSGKKFVPNVARELINRISWNSIFNVILT